jgi:hypothetical protein
MQNSLVRQGVGRWAGIACIAVVCCALLLHRIASAQGVIVTEDQTIADKFVRHTVTGITTPLPVEPDVTGFIGASYLTIADIDGDGINEIVATSGVGPDSDIFTQNGEVALFTWDGVNKGDWTQTILNNTFAFPNETYVRDMNGDGYLDIVVTDEFLANVVGGIYYLENMGGDITDPQNWVKRQVYVDTTSTSKSYHRVEFVDFDGDGHEDIVTMNMSPWAGWLKNNGDGTFTPHTIGTGGGFLFAVFDVNDDGYPDIIAPQLSITTGLFSCVVLGNPDGSDPLGDSLVWFENPGPDALAADPDLLWNRYTIDNWYSSVNPLGKAFETVMADIDGDGTSELVVSNHNHQNKDGGGNRIWPSGIYYFKIPGLNGNPGDPTVTADWVPITIETGNPNFVYASGADRRTDPANDANVPLDVYAVDRRGSFYDQGSPGMIRAGDVTGNGLIDLVVPGDGKGRLYYYEAGDLSEGSLTFKRASLYNDLQCMPGDAQIVDLDGDGDMDIVAAIFDTSVNKPYPYTSSSIFFFEKDSSPELGDGPFVAAGWWPVLSDAQESPTYLSQNVGLLWTFTDDYASCAGDCTHTAEYQALGAGSWTPVDVIDDPFVGTHPYVALPIDQLANATTYAFRFTVTDCADQTTQSGTYYFRVATSDAPPVIIDGPFLASGPWPVFPIGASQAFMLNQNYDVYWTFSDDYASCSGLCTHLFRYRKVGDTAWSTLPVSTNPEGDWYAYVTLPVQSLEADTYEFRMNVRDCAGQWGNSGPKFFKFKVEPPQ